MGRNTNIAAALNNGQTILNTVLPAAEPIQRGDLVLLGQDNKAYAAAMPYASAIELMLRPTAGGPLLENYALASTNLTTVSATGAGDERVDFVKLKNGNIAVVWQDTTASIAKFAIVNQDSEIVKAGPASAAAMPINGETHAIALANGGFAVAVITAAGTAAVTLFDAAGNVTTPQFVTDTNTNSTVIYIAQLTNGNIVTVTRQNGNTIRYAIHTSAGATVKAVAVIASPSVQSAGDRTFGVAALAGGGFVIAYCTALTSQASFYAQRYDAAGAAQGTAITVLTNGNNTNGFTYVAGLTGGGFAVAVATNPMGLYLGIYDASGNVQGGSVLNLGRLYNEIYGNQVALVAAPNGDVGITYNGSGLMVARYSATGALIASRALATGESTGCASMIFHTDGSVAVTSSITGAAKLYLLSPSLVPVFQTSMAMTFSTSFPRLWGSSAVSAKTDLPCYQIIAQNASGGGISAYTSLIRRQAMTLVGVANYAVAANGQLSVQLTGVATLRQPFLQPWSVNLQGSNPAGQRMSAIGNTAILNGLFASTAAPLN